MVQYPCDPGPDQDKPDTYRPVHEYNLVTEEAFSAAMEVQTRYSYECSKQMRDCAIAHSDQIGEDLRNGIHDTNVKLDAVEKKTSEDYQILKTSIKRTAASTNELAGRVSSMEDRMTPEDRQQILSRILGIV